MQIFGALFRNKSVSFRFSRVYSTLGKPVFLIVGNRLLCREKVQKTIIGKDILCRNLTGYG